MAAVDVSRDILSRGDGSSRGSTLYPRVLGDQGKGRMVYILKRRGRGRGLLGHVTAGREVIEGIRKL